MTAVGRWRPCPRCGFSKCGVCPQCYPVEAEAEQRAEIAAWRAEQMAEARRNLEARRLPP